MKKFLLSVLLAAGCVALHAETPMVRQTRFEGRNITGVVAGSSFNVEVYQSDTTRAIVEIPAELQEFLIFQIDSQGVVTLGLDYSWKKKNNVLNEIMRSLRSNGAQMKAKIYITGLRVLKASSSARIRPMTPLTGNSAKLRHQQQRTHRKPKAQRHRPGPARPQQQRTTYERRDSSPRSRLYAEQQAHPPRSHTTARAPLSARAAVRGSTSAEKWAARTSSPAVQRLSAAPGTTSAARRWAVPLRRGLP